MLGFSSPKAPRFAWQLGVRVFGLVWGSFRLGRLIFRLAGWVWFRVDLGFALAW